VVAKFDRRGRYVWRCQILHHEDHDMMRRFEVQALPSQGGGGGGEGGGGHTPPPADKPPTIAGRSRSPSRGTGPSRSKPRTSRSAVRGRRRAGAAPGVGA